MKAMFTILLMTFCEFAMAKPTIDVEEMISVGEEIVIESKSPLTQYAVVFEDDGETGYFYGLDRSRKSNPILDALHIYNVKSVIDKDKPSKVQVVWSGDGKKALLVINRYPHAAFDFESSRSYCRTAFPPPDKKWSKFGNEWDDNVLELFK